MAPDRLRVAALTAAGGLALAAAATVAAPAASAVSVKPTGTMVITYRGNGHGHGLSQYGAYGAALAGRSTAQILKEYYPGTAQKKLASAYLRVLLTGAGTTVTVWPAAGLHVTGISAALPRKNVARYRLRAGGSSGIVLERKTTAKGATFKTVKVGLPDGAQFSRPGGAPVRVALTDGTSTAYFGQIRAVRATPHGKDGGVHVVDRLGYNNYVRGVVPREMPASWSRAATDAQAIAARSYAVYEKQHAGGGYYDICDTSACQVYGGHTHYTKSGAVAWTDFLQAARDTLNKVLTYQGSVIFAQYSASNGGWSTSGGLPYLKAAKDPYDPGKSGDPYINAKKKVTVAHLASYLGLRTVTSITITKRDGHGTWGGRVISATVKGTTKAKKATSKAVSGATLQGAFGLGTTWLTVAAA